MLVVEARAHLADGLEDVLVRVVRRHEGGPHPRVRAQMQMDVWFNPDKVAEVVGAELTLSPIHTAAWNALKDGAGLALRFPRFLKWRDDKGPEQATALDELVAMFKQQAQRRRGGDEEG
ncbi:MAG TPA: hypothetical protein VNX21_09620 [Candidatus Thermoplasmatota archaeon]|nr:hypothetical protein [Candidatus Thermoplasmatota archaeon]